MCHPPEGGFRAAERRVHSDPKGGFTPTESLILTLLPGWLSLFRSGSPTPTGAPTFSRLYYTFTLLKVRERGRMIDKVRQIYPLLLIAVGVILLVWGLLKLLNLV